MADWVTISSLATGAGTLVLAVATFSSVKSANRSARVAERSLLAGVRPVLIPSREDDPTERIRFGDDVVLEVPGHGASVKFKHDVVYLAVALRNGGNGLALIHGWRARRSPRDRTVSRGTHLGDGDDRSESGTGARPELDDFRRQQLDLYIPAGDTGYWQGAMRDPEEPGYAEVVEALNDGGGLWIDLLYGDYQGRQRAVVRLLILQWPNTDGWRATILRYWPVDDDNAGRAT